MADTLTVYVSIGNSDDKLTQQQWSEFQRQFRCLLRRYFVNSHGDWVSEPSSPWQNACFCLEIAESDASECKRELAALAEQFGQDSIAWAVAPKTEFIGPAAGGN